MKKEIGVLNFYTDCMDAESQLKCRRIVDRLIEIIVRSNVTQFEARAIAVVMCNEISDAIKQREKQTIFSIKE